VKQATEEPEKKPLAISIRLLIVDDDPVIRLILERHFSSRGFMVTVVAGGDEALLELSKFRYDLVITDLLMPGIDGLELLRIIRQDYPLMRVIVMTGAVTIENMLNVLKEGAFTFVTKPLDDLVPLDLAVDLAMAMIQGWFDQLSKLQRLKTGSGTPVKLP
jgi:DNA-binding NtrC family response regulator